MYYEEEQIKEQQKTYHAVRVNTAVNILNTIFNIIQGLALIWIALKQ